MSERLTNILGYLTLFAILAAVWVMFGEDPRLEQGARGDKTFMGLDARINDSAKISLAQDGNTVTLTRTDAGWTIAERGGYPADTARVVDFLKGLALSERREPKTDNPDHFARLGLGGKALQISVDDTAGNQVATLDMGIRKDGPAGRSLTYVFQQGDSRSWLVTGLAEASADPAWWLKKPLLDIADSRIRSVDLGTVKLVCAEPGGAFTLPDLKKDEEAAADWTLREPARTLGRMDFEDVLALANPLMDPKATVTLKTVDGLTLTVILYDRDGSIWAQVAAAFSLADLDAGAAGLLPDSPMDGQADADAINARAQGWFFLLPQHGAEALLRDRSDFVKPAPAAAP